MNDNVLPVRHIFAKNRGTGVIVRATTPLTVLVEWADGTTTIENVHNLEREITAADKADQ